MLVTVKFYLVETNMEAVRLLRKCTQPHAVEKTQINTAEHLAPERSEEPVPKASVFHYCPESCPKERWKQDILMPSRLVICK